MKRKDRSQMIYIQDKIARIVRVKCKKRNNIKSYLALDVVQWVADLGMRGNGASLAGSEIGLSTR